MLPPCPRSPARPRPGPLRHLAAASLLCAAAWPVRALELALQAEHWRYDARETTPSGFVLNRDSGVLRGGTERGDDRLRRRVLSHRLPAWSGRAWPGVDNRGMDWLQEDRWLDGDGTPSPARLFLDPRGRISRRSFWLYGVLALTGLTLLARALLDIARWNTAEAEALVNLVLLWPAVAISAKRWHDRDKSAWWVLVALVPLVGMLWLLIDNGFRRGTAGSNRFGAPPAA